MEGIVLKKHGGFYYVMENDILFECKLAGKQKFHQNLHIVAGDLVHFEPQNDELCGVITEVKERKNFIPRPGLANIDQLLIVASIKSPDYDSFLLDKMIALSRYYKIHPSICISKIDLSNDFEKQRIKDIYLHTGIEIFFTDIAGDLAHLEKFLKNKITALTGNSGVGKSSLINRLLGEEKQAVQNISLKLNRGKNTTRTSEFFPLENGYIIDTPGFSALDIDRIMKKEELKYLYWEYEEYSHLCKYHNCTHVHEPHCEIKNKIAEGFFSQERYDNYIKLIKEISETKNYN